MPTKYLVLGLTALLLAGVVVAYAARRSVADDTAPYARWRNGIIVYVRNCEAPANERALLHCAALTCAQRVTERLTNAQQTKLALDTYVRAADGRHIDVHGTLDQYLHAPTLPTGFTCHMSDYRQAEPVFEFGRRAAVGAAGIDFKRQR
jgi:hypothetical protein